MCEQKTVHVVIETQEPRTYLDEGTVGVGAPAVTVAPSEAAARAFFWQRVEEALGADLQDAVTEDGQTPEFGDTTCSTVVDHARGFRIRIVEGESLGVLAHA